MSRRRSLLAPILIVVILWVSAAGALYWWLTRPPESRTIPTVARIVAIREDDRLTVVQSTVDMLTDLVVYNNSTVSRFTQLEPYVVRVGINLGDLVSTTDESGRTIVRVPAARVLSTEEAPSGRVPLVSENTTDVNPFANGVERFLRDYAEYYVRSNGTLDEADRYLPQVLSPWFEGPVRFVGEGEANPQTEDGRRIETLRPGSITIVPPGYPVIFDGSEQGIGRWTFTEGAPFPTGEFRTDSGGGIAPLTARIYPIIASTSGIEESIVRQLGRVFLPTPRPVGDTPGAGSESEIRPRYFAIYRRGNSAQLNAFLQHNGVIHELIVTAEDEGTLAEHLHEALALAAAMTGVADSADGRLIPGLTADRWGAMPDSERSRVLGSVYRAYAEGAFYAGTTPAAWPLQVLAEPAGAAHPAASASDVLGAYRRAARLATAGTTLMWLYEYAPGSFGRRPAFRLLYFFSDGSIAYYEGARSGAADAAWDVRSPEALVPDTFRSVGYRPSAAGLTSELGIPQDSSLGHFVESDHFQAFLRSIGGG